MSARTHRIEASSSSSVSMRGAWPLSARSRRIRPFSRSSRVRDIARATAPLRFGLTGPLPFMQELFRIRPYLPPAYVTPTIAGPARVHCPPPMAHPRLRHFLSLGPSGFHRVAYTEWGSPHNPHAVVCVHGLTRNSRDFDYLA